MLPFRVFVRVHVVKGRKSVWKSEDITMVTLDGKQSQTRAVGAAMSILGLIAAIRKMPLKNWLNRPKPIIIRRKKKPIKKTRAKQSGVR